jgi:prolyl oligopeptidase
MHLDKLCYCKIICLTLILIAQYGCRSAKLVTHPLSHKVTVTDTIWDIPISDPYRWLEKIDSDTTQNWIKTQTRFANLHRGKLFLTMKDYIRIYKFADFKPLTLQGNYYFHQRIINIQQAPVLFYQTDPDKLARQLFDPNTIDSRRKFTIDGYQLSPDEQTLALILSEGGSDWKTIRFLDMQKRRLLPDSIDFVKYSPVYWSENGVFYIRYQVEDVRESFSGLIGGRSLYYHKLGTAQSDDLLVYGGEARESDFGYEVTPGGDFLILYHTTQDNEHVFHTVSQRKLPLDHMNPLQAFITSERDDVYYNVIGEADNRLLVESNLNAPNGAIFSIDPDTVNMGYMLFPPLEEQLEYSMMIKSLVFKVYYDGLQTFALVSNTNGELLTAWSLPEGYFLSGFSGSQDGDIAIYHFHSFFSPGTFSSIDLSTMDRKPLGKTSIFFDPDDLTTRKVWYPSSDGTMVPMFLTHKKDLKPSHPAPVILYGYGGFGISMKPFYDAGNLIFLKNGGILATPGLRGGGEFPGWHEEGKQHKKQNTIDDFIAAAEYLIQEGYTNSALIAAMGGSNGGLVVGAAMVQRPELFKVVVSNAGALDMLRYHLYNIGYSYAEEFGNIKDSLDFVYLNKYSPYHNIKEGVIYPATLLVAAANDDRVNPFHSFKFTAGLQEKTIGDNPIVLYYQEDAGHTTNKIMDSQLETEAYIYSFVFQHLGMNRRARFKFY